MRPGGGHEGRRRRSGQLGHGLLPALLVARLARRVDLGEADHAVGVDQERAADRQARRLVEHTVRASHVTVRPEVGQQRELVALLLGPRLERERRVDRDAQHLDALVVVVGELVAELAELAGADAAERERVEDQQYRFVTPEGRQLDGLLVVVVEREVRGFRADLDGHTAFPLPYGHVLPRQPYRVIRTRLFSAAWNSTSATPAGCPPTPGRH